jgi:hypothetical protein
MSANPVVPRRKQKKRKENKQERDVESFRRGSALTWSTSE